MDIRQVAVIGLGTMGAGIAEVFARAGIGVVAVEVDSSALNHGLGILDSSLSKAVSRGKLAASEQAAIRARIRPATGFSEAAAVDLAVEVVPERMEIKRQIFAELDRVTSPAAILATNTSSLSVTAIAAATKHPGRVVGMHFFNPAPVMRLVEVVSTVLADDGVADTVAALADARRQTSRAETEHLAAREKAVTLREDAARLRETRIDGMRAELAATLTDGAPCPVCGSLDHPELCELRDEQVTRAQEAAATAAAEAAIAAAEQVGKKLRSLMPWIDAKDA